MVSEYKPVLDKMECIFERKQDDKLSNKQGRFGSAFIATEVFTPSFLESVLKSKYVCTLKADGSGGYIKNGQLCKRYDKKIGRNPPIEWFQTSLSSKENHIIGFIPIKESEKADKWHLDCFTKLPDGTINMENIRTIHYDIETKKIMYKEEQINTLEGKSVEVLGEKFQSNPHNLKQHCVMVHGNIPIDSFPNLKAYVDHETGKQILDVNGNSALDVILKWFETDTHAQYAEGIVLHFENGMKFKLHRHHLNLMWKENKNDSFTIPSLDTFSQ